MKAKINLKNIIAYIQGNIRYKFYYSNFLHKFIPKHIKEQIDFRIAFMDDDCYNNGQCKLCGCKTTHLQMANKECDKPCYPKIMSIKKWSKFKSYKVVKVGNNYWQICKCYDNCFILLRNNTIIKKTYGKF